MTDAFVHLSSGFPPHGEGNGGDEGNRTLDPLLAGQVLSQLSYTPIKISASVFSMNFTACAVLDH